MDKYEFKIRVEQIKKNFEKEDYETAMSIADTIDWRRVRSTTLLTMISQIYEKNEDYHEAKEILLLAYEHAPIGKRLLYKLTELALKEEDIKDAEDYYKEFCRLVPDDPRQNILRYLILKAKDASVEQKIHSLEKFCSAELDEKWLYELAELYAQAGREDLCVAACDKLMLMFGIGQYVDKAMELKQLYAPLNSYQMDLVENREKYEENLRAVTRKYDTDLLYEEQSAQAPQETSIEEDEEAEEEPLPEEEETAPEEEEEADPVRAEETEEPVSRILPEPEEEEEPEEKEEPEASADADAEEEEEEIHICPQMRNHLMIEARTPEAGLEMAKDALRKIHEQTGSINQVIKITGSKLSRRGVLASAEKLAGRDLIIDEAGDLNEADLEELKELMEQDETGMIVVLIDNPRQMEALHRSNPELSTWFECIGSRENTTYQPEPEEELAPEKVIERAVRRKVDLEERKAREEEAPKETIPEEAPAEEDRPVREEALPAVKKVKKGKEEEPRQEAAPEPAEEETGAEEEEMSAEAFADYAIRYAESIDCSITGKSRLALYEQIEIMEEDGIPLTARNAEDLIERVADNAENPSFGKRLKGMFASKYDKEGLLILREEHFTNL